MKPAHYNLDVRGLRVHWVEWGERGRRPVILVHGFRDEERARHLAYHGMRRSEAGAWQWKFDPLHRTTSPQPFYLEQFREFLRRITCPTLVVQGAESEHRTRGDIQARHGWLPGAELVTLPDAGHMVHQDNPEALVRTLAPFLA